MNLNSRESRAALVRKLGLWTAVVGVLVTVGVHWQLATPAPEADLQVTIAAPKECFADQPASFQVHVVNNGNEASREGLEFRIYYGTLSSNMPGQEATQPSIARNAVRETKIFLPALAAKESQAFQLKLTPRRIGDFRVWATLTRARIKMASASSQVRFDPNSSVGDMLPVCDANLTPRLPTSLADVTELSLENRAGASLKLEESFEHVVHTMDKINYINGMRSDAHAAALLEKRPDMNGVPMAMGDACRLKPEQAAHFSRQATDLRIILGDDRLDLADRLAKLGSVEQTGAPHEAAKTSARIAALVQIFGPESAPLRVAVIKHLATMDHAEAGRAIAGWAVFAPEAEVRTAAIDALKNRQEQDYAEVLVRGLNYPWPDAAGNAADAIVKLKKTSLLPQLVDLLEGPDPRGPQTGSDGKLVVREMVKINHLSNCLLCHAPRGPNMTTQPSRSEPLLVAPAPLPNQPLTVSMGSGVAYYSDFPIPDVLIRFDVTYLRQDFSVMLPVADHQPWPQMQRFDFLVRTRAIGEKDADTYRTLLRPPAGALNPYQKAALVALRELTGRNADPTGPAWRSVLEKIQSEG